jgi:hypothetical protein
MKVVNCTNCSAVNADATPESKCRQCGEPLAPALLQQSLDALNSLTAKLQEARSPKPSFYSFNGFGTMLLDYRALPDGNWEAVRWVTALWLPVVPLSAYRIQPLEQERTYGRETSKFRVLDKAPLSASRIVRTYALAVAGLLPPILGVVYADEINRVVRGWWALGLMVLMAVWSVYIIFFKIPNESKAYQARDNAGVQAPDAAAKEKST